MLDFEPEVPSRWCAAEDLFGVRVKLERVQEPPSLGDELFATDALCSELADLAARMQPPDRSGGFGDDSSIEVKRELPSSPSDGVLKRETSGSSPASTPDELSRDGDGDDGGGSRRRRRTGVSERLAAMNRRRERNRLSAQLSRERHRTYVGTLELGFDALKKRLADCERELREARRIVEIAEPETHSIAPALRRIAQDARLRRRWRRDFAVRSDGERRELDALIRELRSEVTGSRSASAEAPF